MAGEHCTNKEGNTSTWGFPFIHLSCCIYILYLFPEASPFPWTSLKILINLICTSYEIEVIKQLLLLALNTILVHSFIELFLTNNAVWHSLEDSSSD